MRKHHCQHFYIHQHQVELSLIPFPVFTATNYCQGTVNLGFLPIIFCVSRKFCLCKYFFLLQNKIRFTETISHLEKINLALIFSNLYVFIVNLTI